jgi:hypothetical protein
MAFAPGSGRSERVQQLRGREANQQSAERNQKARLHGIDAIGTRHTI